MPDRPLIGPPAPPRGWIGTGGPFNRAFQAACVRILEDPESPPSAGLSMKTTHQHHHTYTSVVQPYTCATLVIFTFYFGESLGRKQAKWAKKKPQV